ncbi:MAG: drug/metabolite transporter (DMT)-like permease [Motiliproteus sp.]|jgi:drug/metabolite transporter (DMT)-like permease
MQPEHSPPDNQKVSSGWHDVTLLPTLIAFIGVSLIFVAWFAGGEGSHRATHWLAIFLAALMIVVSVAGLIGYKKQPGRQRRLKMIALWNLLLLLGSFLFGLFLLLTDIAPPG